ncbi:hypothetical protein [Naasia aerilata]|uniref:Uncharacterized protein n=1 Tax=Naasia aerilata TaxID=1162966 RepID=A0ABM8G8D4_9MICO|nr:hypothetical protein [Naasia aerilata]BDZ44447.1 hypothetical protein GCM10025866_03560 [Naasia aerilata]
MTPIRVHTEVPAYAVALRELPVSAVAAPAAQAEIHVVEGSARPDGQLAGTVLVLAGDPPASAAGIEALRRSGARVVLERRRLRRDLVDDALAARADRGAAPPRMLVAECLAGAEQLAAVLRDALGWSRELGGALTQDQSSADDEAVSALLAAGPDRIPVLLRATVAPDARSFVRVRALGEVTTEIVVEELGSRCSVSTTDAAGREEAPRRFESVERFTVRRALAALAGEDLHDDVADLVADAALVDHILSGRSGAA